MAINCCYGCVAPKRNPYCHSYCLEYIAEKAEHDKLKAEIDREREVSGAILSERGNKVYNAMKNRMNKKL